MIRFLLTVLLLNLFSNTQPKTGKGIVYFSFDNGKTWENRSKGLPDDIFLSDMAVGNNVLALATKKSGIFTFDFAINEWKRVNTIPIESDEINSLYLYGNKIFAGTKNNGIFISSDKGDNWKVYNEGLKNLTIRKFIVIANKMYACTNGGLYFFDEMVKRWRLEYGHHSLQVNGIKELDGEIYIGTNQGAFKRKKDENEWRQIISDRSLHNISSDSRNIYALTYNELFISPDKGSSWYSDQKGMPAGMYSFQVIEKDNTVLAGQWDGVYSKTSSQGWKLSSNGLPGNFPVVELVVNGDIIVAGSSQWSSE
jgi:hypothetical protein